MKRKGKKGRKKKNLNKTLKGKAKEISQNIDKKSQREKKGKSQRWKR